MNWIAIVLIYLLGLEIVFMHAMVCDERTMLCHGTFGGFNKFTSYLILCIFWPVTMWFLMVFRYLDVRDMSRAVQKRGAQSAQERSNRYEQTKNDGIG